MAVRHRFSGMERVGQWLIHVFEFSNHVANYYSQCIGLLRSYGAHQVWLDGSHGKQCQGHSILVALTHISDMWWVVGRSLHLGAMLIATRQGSTGNGKRRLQKMQLLAPRRGSKNQGNSQELARGYLTRRFKRRNGTDGFEPVESVRASSSLPQDSGCYED